MRLPKNVLPLKVTSADTENGRPNTGLNSPDNIQVDNAETQKEYRQQQEDIAQSAAQNAIATKYDAAQYKQDVLDARGSEEAAAILSNLYTGKIATITEPPPVVFRKNGKAYFSQGKIHLDPNIKTWHGTPTTIRHEFGHFVDRNTRRKDPQLQAKMTAAATADWQKVNQHGHVDYSKFINSEKNKNEKSIDIFGKEYKLLSDDEKIRIAGWFDTIGSITNGRHGFGHSKSEYVNGYENAEAFANIYAAINSGHTEYKKYFPEMWKVIEGIIK